MKKSVRATAGACALGCLLGLVGCGDSSDEGLPANPKPSVTQDQMRELSTMKVPPKSGLPKAGKSVGGP